MIAEWDCQNNLKAAACASFDAEVVGLFLKLTATVSSQEGGKHEVNIRKCLTAGTRVSGRVLVGSVAKGFQMESVHPPFTSTLLKIQLGHFEGLF